MMHNSATVLRVRERAFFIKYDCIRPNKTPMRVEIRPRRIKSSVISPTALAPNSLSPVLIANLFTVLNRMIETASLTIPSPKTKLNNFGVFLGFNMETAAITSVEHRSEHMSNTSIVVKLTLDTVSTPVSGSS